MASSSAASKCVTASCILSAARAQDSGRRERDLFSGCAEGDEAEFELAGVAHRAPAPARDAQLHAALLRAVIGAAQLRSAIRRARPD